MHSLTYTQKSCRQNAGSRDAYVYMRTFFATRKPQQANQRAESKKNAYTIYTLNIHFLYSKSAYTIYTPETTFPAGSSTSNGPVTTLPPRKFAGSRQKYTKQLLSHLTFCRHIHIFSPIFPASFKTANMEYTSNRRRKKRKRGIKRC